MKKNRTHLRNLARLGTALVFALGASACGVKGPPLPPVADTPQASDRGEPPAAKPSPSPSPAAKKKTKGKAAGR